jgi:hypothetical protein
MVVRNTLWDHCVTLVIWYRRLISINLSHRLGARDSSSTHGTGGLEANVWPNFELILTESPKRSSASIFSPPGIICFLLCRRDEGLTIGS